MGRCLFSVWQVIFLAIGDAPVNGGFSELLDPVGVRDTNEGKRRFDVLYLLLAKGGVYLLQFVKEQSRNGEREQRGRKTPRVLFHLGEQLVEHLCIGAGVAHAKAPAYEISLGVGTSTSQWLMDMDLVVQAIEKECDVHRHPGEHIEDFDDECSPVTLNGCGKRYLRKQKRQRLMLLFIVVSTEVKSTITSH